MASDTKEGRTVFSLIHPMEKSSDPVDRIVVAIWRDVTDRRGWRQEHDQFSNEIQIEIVETWRNIVRNILKIENRGEKEF